MSIASIYTKAVLGMRSKLVTVECHVANGLPSFSMVGLPDTEVRESRDRVRSAIQNSGFDFPARRITVNLAPADLPKSSGSYDLPIALSILVASGLIEAKIDLSKYFFAGELALDGSLRDVKCAIALVTSDADNYFVLPVNSATQANYAIESKVYGLTSLKDVIALVTKEQSFDLLDKNSIEDAKFDYLIDFAEVKGQTVVKKALEIAAAGRHSILMVGNPGCGKSMLAGRLPTILPNMNYTEALESAIVRSLSNQEFDFSEWGKIPFRHPHHSSSNVALVGGGGNPVPGEISLAHNGVLFLDELPEFDRKVLEALREPLETKVVNVSRAKFKVEFPADFQLISAMNPCPCGNLGHPVKICKCNEEQISRYVSKISGPLLDRIDMVVDVPTLTVEELSLNSQNETSSMIKSRVIKAREFQYARQGKLNYALSNSEVEKHVVLSNEASGLIQLIVAKLGLSGRSYYRLLKLARTIADLEQQEVVESRHISQANQFKKSI